MIIDINVQDKIARVVNPLNEIVCGNSDYTINFAFDAEWEEYRAKTARFTYNGGYTDVVFDGNKCAVPILQNTDAVFVGVYAGDLHTTTPAFINCKKSILCRSGSPKPPTDDVYAQLMEMINGGMLRGPQGEKGDSPVKGVDYWTEEDKKEITDYVDKEIAEFDFVKVVDTLPKTGLVNREYFVRKANPETNDLFDEYAWINKGTEEEPNWDWEFKGTKKIEIDLAEYVKFTDVGGQGKVGVVCWRDSQGIYITADGTLQLVTSSPIHYEYRGEGANRQKYSAVTIEMNDYATMVALADCKEPELWTDDSKDENGNVVKGTKTKACETIGAVKAITTSDPNYRRMYMVDKDGNQVAALVVNYGTPLGNTVVMSGDNGNITVNPNPALYNDATSKWYVDGLIEELRAEIEVLKAR